MSEKEIVQCFAVGIVAFWVGVVIGQKRIAQKAGNVPAVELGAGWTYPEASQPGAMQGSADGTGAFAMDWFTNWGKGP